MLSIYPQKDYTLYLGDDPSELFRYFDVDEMFGLNLSDCLAHENTRRSSYIAGLCNVSPIDNEMFVFINLKRCTSEKATATLVFHEMMHLSKAVHGTDFWVANEEEVIEYAERETENVMKIIENDDLAYANQFWRGYFWGSLVGIFAGIAIGWLMYG